MNMHIYNNNNTSINIIDKRNFLVDAISNNTGKKHLINANFHLKEIGIGTISVYAII